MSGRWPEGLPEWIGSQDDDLFRALDKALRSFGWPDYNVPRPPPMETSWPALALELAQRLREAAAGVSGAD
jgi:hypothetical protein